VKTDSTGVIVQARMGSTRLPKKMLVDINGRSVIGMLLDSLRNLPDRFKVVVAISNHKDDDVLCSHIKELGFEIFRGDENDVLSRYYNCSLKFGFNQIIRIPGDNPFIPISLINFFIQKWEEIDNIDYMSNILEDSYPIGMHFEIMTFEALEQAYKNSSEEFEREHVTPYIYNNSKFKCFNIQSEFDFSNYRFTIDYFEDIQFARILDKLITKEVDHDINALIKIVKENPSLKKINQKYWKSQSIKIK